MYAVEAANAIGVPRAVGVVGSISDPPERGDVANIGAHRFAAPAVGVD
jgi:hypothetical protein